MLNNLDNLKINILGASHADRITLIVDGLPKGKKIDLSIILYRLLKDNIYINNTVLAYYKLIDFYLL